VIRSVLDLGEAQAWTELYTSDGAFEMIAVGDLSAPNLKARNNSKGFAKTQSVSNREASNPHATGGSER